MFVKMVKSRDARGGKRRAFIHKLAWEFLAGSPPNNNGRSYTRLAARFSRRANFPDGNWD